LGNSSAVTGPAFTVLGVVLSGILEEKEDICGRTWEELHSEHTVSSLLTEADCRSVKSFRQSSQ
jgi:hypothetical protein